MSTHAAAILVLTISLILAPVALAAPAGSTDPGECLAPGDAAPDVQLTDPYGYPVKLSDMWNRGPVVLYFYPKDFTPGCTLESEGFRDSIQEFADARILVVGVSIDTPDSHRQFTDRLKLPFPLLSDPHAAAAEAYRVQKTYYGFITSRRVTYLIDSDGSIAWAWDNVEPVGHPQDVLDTARRLGMIRDEGALESSASPRP